MKTSQPHRTHAQSLLKQGDLDHRHKPMLFQPLTAAFLGKLLLDKKGVYALSSHSFFKALNIPRTTSWKLRTNQFVKGHTENVLQGTALISPIPTLVSLITESSHFPGADFSTHLAAFLAQILHLTQKCSHYS